MCAFPNKVYITGLAYLCLSSALFGAPNATIELCARCHGGDGMSRGAPLIPIIAGMPAPHIEEAIHAYVDEGRRCVRMQWMCETVSALMCRASNMAVLAR